MSRRLLSGHEVEKATEEVVTNTKMIPFLHGMVRILPEGWLYPGTAPTFLDKIQTMKFRNDDVLLITFPKCGTTWTQEILWTMLHNPNLDNPEADESLWLRSWDISFDMIFDSECLGGLPIESIGKRFEELYPGRGKEDGVMLELVDATKSPRVIKCHFPLTLLPRDILDRVKVVYVARNVKDVVVSFWEFFKSVTVHKYRGSLEDLARLIMNGGTFYCPFWPHVKDAWQKRHHPNLHFVFFEDMKADIMLELRKINEFLGTRLSQETLEAVKEYTSFSAMKTRGNPLSDKVFDKNTTQDPMLFRKGTTKDWKNYFSPELQKEMDQWIKENLEGSDLSLTWALAQ